MSDAGPARPPEYVGLITRAIAFAVDAVVIKLVALVVGSAAALAASVFHLPKEIRHALLIIGGIAFVVSTIAYFVTFWSRTRPSHRTLLGSARNGATRAPLNSEPAATDRAVRRREPAAQPLTVSLRRAFGRSRGPAS